MIWKLEYQAPLEGKLIENVAFTGCRNMKNANMKTKWVLHTNKIGTVIVMVFQRNVVLTV